VWVMVILGVILVIIIGLYFQNISNSQPNIDTSECDQIESRFYKFECYEQVAIENKNLITCDKIGVTVDKFECYEQVAIESLDLESCDKINLKSKTK